MTTKAEREVAKSWAERRGKDYGFTDHIPVNQFLKKNDRERAEYLFKWLMALENEITKLKREDK